MKTKFCILSYPRSGSHLLKTSLQSHKLISICGEYYGRVKKYVNGGYLEITDSSMEEIYNRAITVKHPSQLAAGFLLHRITHDDVMFLDYLLSDTDVKIIFLDRFNLLKQYISWELSLIKLTWRVQMNNKNSYEDDAAIEFNGQKFLNSINTYKERKAFYIKKFENHKICFTSYEKLTAEFDEECKKLQNFLEVPVQKLLPSVTKMNKRTIEETVSNYKYMVSFLHENNLEHYLDNTLETEIK